jgi:hypothetical protein
MSTEIVKPPDPVRQIVGWIIAGQAEPDIRDAIAATWPDAKPRPLIVAALKQLAKAGEPDMNLVRGFAIEGTREIYRKALEVADHQTALRALKQLVDLAGK